MSKFARLAIVALLAVAVVLAVSLRRGDSGPQPARSDKLVTPVESAQSAAKPAQPRNDKPRAVVVASRVSRIAKPKPITKVSEALPKIVDLGAEKCIPCKMMVGVLGDLRKEYKDKLTVVFIDIWKDEKAGKRYGVEVIPTQILYDANGREIFRHQGYFPKKDILAK
jgi:thioredoxin 1